MTARFLVLLLFAMIGLAAWDAAEIRQDRANAIAGAGDSSQAQVMDGGNGLPPKPY